MEDFAKLNFVAPAVRAGAYTQNREHRVFVEVSGPPPRRPGRRL
jgi:hypothetical protein